MALNHGTTKKARKYPRTTKTLPAAQEAMNPRWGKQPRRHRNIYKNGGFHHLSLQSQQNA
jgi:hypothetical protein